MKSVARQNNLHQIRCTGDEDHVEHRMDEAETLLLVGDDCVLGAPQFRHEVIFRAWR